MQAWRVIINEQDGTGGGNDKEFLFRNYDEAHRFYVYIKSLKGTSFYPSITEPPNKIDIEMPPIWGDKELRYGKF